MLRGCLVVCGALMFVLLWIAIVLADEFRKEAAWLAAVGLMIGLLGFVYAQRNRS